LPPSSAKSTLRNLKEGKVVRSANRAYPDGRYRRIDAALRISDLLRDRIVHGYYPDRHLPSESDLGLEFASSRNAVRDALSLLRSEGVLQRMQGVGTTVLTNKFVHRFDCVHSVHEAARDATAVRGCFISSQTVVATPALTERLGLAHSAVCTRLEFVTFVGETPVAVTRSYVPGGSHGVAIGAEFSGDYYHWLEKSGIAIGSVQQSVEATLADPWAAKLLAIGIGAAVMMFSRTLYDPDGRPVETGFVRVTGDRIRLEVDLPRLKDIHENS
jgi:GntR family transcriptional regulator